jgi:mRNA-degrading endonuclease toxin of MazEF toxin-antitoxin module
MIRPGEIYLADFEEMEPHPIVVVSREELNRGNWVAAVLTTSKRFEERSKQPHCVPFRAGEFGLTRDCVAQGESLFSTTHRSRTNELPQPSSRPKWSR